MKWCNCLCVSLNEVVSMGANVHAACFAVDLLQIGKECRLICSWFRTCLAGWIGTFVALHQMPACCCMGTLLLHHGSIFLQCLWQKSRLAVMAEKWICTCGREQDVGSHAQAALAPGPHQAAGSCTISKASAVSDQRKAFLIECLKACLSVRWSCFLAVGRPHVC